MTQPAITIDGDERLISTAHHAADELADMEATNRAIGESVRARAAGKAPKVSGRLAGSVRVSAVAKLEVVISSDLVYAPPINYGWPSRGVPAQPFMTDALAESQALALEAYSRRVNSTVDDIKGA